MSWKQTSKYRVFVISSALLFLFTPVAVFAAESSSADYQVNEVFFGGGGALNDCSATYCAKESIGETAVGDTASAHYQAHTGFNTDRNPYLQFIVNSSTVNIGALSTGSTTTTTATFSVEDYLSSGYQVVTVSNPPQNNTYTLHNLTTQTSSSAGTEQFGMNLVANTGCTGISGTLGSNPVQVPSSTFSFGVAGNGITTDYDTPCEFKYVPGNVIASSNKSSGQTDFTISYIYNISNLTPGGQYSFNDVLVATATF